MIFIFHFGGLCCPRGWNMSLEVALTTFLDCQSSSTFFGCSAAAVMCLAMKENTPSGAQAVEPVEYPKYHWLPRPQKTPFKKRFLVGNRDLFRSPLSQSNRSTCVQTKVFCYRRYWPKCCTSGLNMYNTNKIQVLPISMPVEPATF